MKRRSLGHLRRKYRRLARLSDMGKDTARLCGSYRYRTVLHGIAKPTQRDYDCAGLIGALRSKASEAAFMAGGR